MFSICRVSCSVPRACADQKTNIFRSVQTYSAGFSPPVTIAKNLMETRGSTLKSLRLQCRAIYSPVPRNRRPVPGWHLDPSPSWPLSATSQLTKTSVIARRIAASRKSLRYSASMRYQEVNVYRATPPSQARLSCAGTPLLTTENQTC